VVLSTKTKEVEYMVATHVGKEAVRLKKLCSSMGLLQ